ncbi:MAG: D-alanine--D-alanine ligase family protein [Candidatus Aminicenantes bacterium]|jgi:D-alanine-D-alanine ligase
MKKKKICILFGGRSAEHEVSLVSAQAIFKNLNSDLYEVTSVFINKEGAWRIVDSPLLEKEDLNSGSFFSFLPWRKHSNSFFIDADVYFPVLHGPYGEDGTIQGLFEMADVPYVGATVLASAAGMDKAVAKTLFKEKNLPVVNFITVKEADWNREPGAVRARVFHTFALPFFVKPSNLGSSVGITKVKDFALAEQAIKEAFLFDRKVLIEEGIEGREMECSVLGNDFPKASLPGEIIPYNEFYDYRDKYIDGKTTFGIPADLPQKVAEDIQKISIEAFQCIDCSGMARVDFFLQKGTGKIYLNELNTIPGFTEISMYPKLWEKSGLPFPRLLTELINLAIEKHTTKKRGERTFTA